MTTAKINKKGFKFDGKRIYFMDGHGKDISFNRWRIILYYRLGFAITYLVASQEEYDAFINKYQPDCFEDYTVFRANSS